MFYCIAYDKPYYLLNYYCGFNGFGSTYESVYTLWLHLVNEPNVIWLYNYGRQCIICTTDSGESVVLCNMSIVCFMGHLVTNYLEY